jgi:metal-dependent HD superfamily phosphatase/phosphodiesterase
LNSPRRYQTELETELGGSGIEALSSGLAAIEQVIRRSGKRKPLQLDDL